MTVPRNDDGMKQMFRTMPQQGTVTWLGVRPGRDEPVAVVRDLGLSRESGVEGDRFDGGQSKERQVTLIQEEHLLAIGSILGKAIDPTMTRRNIVVRGINLQALRKTQFRIGDVILEGLGNCPPCSKMERNLGPGGYNAMRGHGGICARVILDGRIATGDPVEFVKLLD